MINADEGAALRHALVANLIEGGSLRDPRWIAAFEKVPRHVFVPWFLVRQPAGTFQPVDGTDPAQHHAWLEQVYADEPLVTEADGTFAVSSSSQPSLMAEMLEALEISGPERVLEIGTGTGYNAALLCEGLGCDDRVVSVEIARDLVDKARKRLADLGYRPTLSATDGAAGYPDDAPYDRVIATCSMPRVPRPWIMQVRDGGLILVNLYRGLGGGALACLRVENGRATGHFMPYFAGFMPTRTYQRVTAVTLLDASQADHEHGEATRRLAIVGAQALEDDAFGMFAALRLDAEQLWLSPHGRPEQFWLLDHEGSWAYQTTDDNGDLIAVQAGAERLWDRLEAAYADWVALGCPSREEFGLTVTPEGEHLIWHGGSDGASWRL